MRGFDRRSAVTAPPSFSIDPPADFPYFFRLVVDGANLPAIPSRTASRGPPRRRNTARGDTLRVTEKPPNKVTAWRQVGLLSSIPFILALAPIVGYFLGKYLDTKFRTSPWLGIILLILGFFAGVRETINIVKLSQRED
jgi:hypothetical protein